MFTSALSWVHTPMSKCPFQSPIIILPDLVWLVYKSLTPTSLEHKHVTKTAFKTLFKCH